MAILSTKSADYNKTLFCDDWIDSYFKEKFESFKSRKVSISPSSFAFFFPISACRTIPNPGIK